MKKYSALILILVVAMTAVVVVALTFALRSANRASTETPNEQMTDGQSPVPQWEQAMEAPLRITAMTVSPDTGDVELAIETGDVEVSAFAIRIFVSESMGEVVFTPSAELTQAGWTYPVNETTEEEQRSVDVAAAYVSPDAYQIAGEELVIGTLSVENFEANLAIDEEISKVVSKNGKIYPLEFINGNSTQ